VGQPFSVVLTCAVLENESVRVVPDESPLAVGTVQLAPFELLSGSHPADLRSGQRRFFQYDYNLRLVEPSAIGRDVGLPTLVIHYRVESRLQAQALEGRDRTYVLPSQSVHITSNVPADAPDIRDGSDAPFGAVEATRFRARMFDIAAMALGALGIILLVPAAIRAMGLSRKRVKRHGATVTDRAVIGRALSELATAHNEGRGGWTPDLVARALTSARLLAGYAISRPANQQPLASGAQPPDARVAVMSGLAKKRRVSVASAVTPDDLGRALEQLPLANATQRRALLDRLRDALTTLTRAEYAAEPPQDAEVDEAVRATLAAGQHVKREHAWWRARWNRLERRA
jgi:hypothetical protein